MKKRVIKGDLSLQFYAKDGWTKMAVQALLDDGSVVTMYPDSDNEYYIINYDSKFNLQKTLEATEGITEQDLYFYEW